MAGPEVYLSAPPRSLFKFPPDEQPYAIPPPSSDPWIKAPFHIDPDFYQAVLQPKVPITFAVCYIAVVLSLNAFNRSRKWRPWSISKSRLFTPLVVLHNVALAVFSAATFVAMVRAIHVSSPEMTLDTTPADIADSLCKMNGPRGLGSAVTFDTLTNTWSSTNSIVKLAGGLPDSTDVGRIWNEGLAFWGWTFYLSKFYEVIDTLVILARGKRSPTLQTYHHAGAMLCMWSGMRWMSPPIWIFVVFNSFIHTLMYIYFTLNVLGVKISKTLKQTLTTMQIMQFVVGSSLAAFHLFISYDVPVTTPYQVVSPIKSAAAAASSVVSSVVNSPPSINSIVSSAASVAAHATASPHFGAVLKRLLLRAAGGEGAAENVRDSYGQQQILQGANSVQSSVSSAASVASMEAVSYVEETRYRQSFTTVHCIDTTGQSFAIWLNLVYLAPLTALFVRFFVKAYITGTLGKGKPARRTSFTEATTRAIEQARRGAEQAGQDLERVLSREVKGVNGDLKVESAVEESDEEEGTISTSATPDKKKQKKRSKRKSKANGLVLD